MHTKCIRYFYGRNDRDCTGTLGENNKQAYLLKLQIFSTMTNSKCNILEAKSRVIWNRFKNLTEHIDIKYDVL